jgi:spoIIIJ-associated protein
VETKRFSVATTGQQIQTFVQQIITNAGFDVKFEVKEAGNLHPDFENPDLVVRFTGPDVELLLANKAELLLAMEQLTLESLRIPHHEHALLQFDAHDYRALRIEELRMSALLAADKVKRSKVPYEFSPMTSRERRIIHLALRNEPAVRSESGGVGPYRKVIVYPADMPSKPVSAPPPFRRRR